MRLKLPDFNELTRQQKPLVSIDLDSPEGMNGWGGNLVVKGYGGTGKTVVAYYRAMQMDRKGKKYAFLCFGKSLNKLINTYKDYKLKGDVFHLQRFYDKIRDVVLNRLRNNEKLYYKGGYFYKQTFQKFIKRNRVGEAVYKDYDYIVYQVGGRDIPEIVDGYWRYANNQTKEFLSLLFGFYKEVVLGDKYMYDEIIIDEGQDVSPAFLKCLKILSPHFSVFFDENQSVYGDGGSGAAEKDMINIFGKRIDELTIIMRSPREICEFAAECFLPENEQAKMLNQSKYCRSLPSSKPEEFEFDIDDNKLWKDKILEIIKNRKKNEQGNLDSVCVFFSQQGPIDDFGKFLDGKDVDYGMYYNSIDFKKNDDKYNDISNWVDNDIFLTTYQSAKGLEADIVIIVITKQDYEEWYNSEPGSLKQNMFYVLCTRAKTKLYIIYRFKEN